MISRHRRLQSPKTSLAAAMTTLFPVTLMTVFPTFRVAEAAANVFAQAGDDVSEQIALLRKGNAVIRAEAARELARLGPKAKAAIPDLIAVLGDNRMSEPLQPGRMVYPVVREDVSLALFRIGPEALPAIVEAMLREDKAEIGLRAAMTLLVFIERDTVKEGMILGLRDALSIAMKKCGASRL